MLIYFLGKIQMGPNGGEDGDGGEMKTFGGEESREAAFIMLCFMFH